MKRTPAAISSSDNRSLFTSAYVKVAQASLMGGLPSLSTPKRSFVHFRLSL